MQSFKSFIAEGKDSFELLVKELDEHLAAGTIMKPRFDDLKYKLDHMVEREESDATDPHTLGKGAELHDKHPGLNEVMWARTSNLHEVFALKNKLAKTSPEERNHPLHLALQAHYDRWIPVAEKFKRLKTMIVTVTQKRAADKVVKDELQKKAFRDSHSLITVLSEHKAEFVQRAKERAKDYYQRMIDQLHAVGNDLDKIAPAPNYKMGSEEYRRARDKRHFYSEIQRKGLATLVDEAGEHAENDYMAWITKMTEKIGKVVVDSSMHGSPWTGSTLSVTCVDGEKQTWHTQMIINQSKYQNLFNQFPSRRIK